MKSTEQIAIASAPNFRNRQSVATRPQEGQWQCHGLPLTVACAGLYCV